MNDCRTRCKISVVLSSTFVSILFQNWYKSLFQLPLQLFQLYQSVFDCVQTFVSFAPTRGTLLYNSIVLCAKSNTLCMGFWKPTNT